MKNVDVIIVNYKTPALTVEAVQSVLREPEVNNVYVIDNGSEDDSKKIFSEKMPTEYTELIWLNNNLGFGQANNLGARAAKASYIFLLNSDATVKPGTLALLVALLEQNPQVGIAAPIIYLEDGVTLQADAQGNFPTASAILTGRSRRPANSFSPDWVSGVAILCRRQEFLEIGGFSPELFMYFEDVELCYRYHRAGKKVARVPGTGVIHLGGSSFKQTSYKKKLYYLSQDTYLRLTNTSFLGRSLVRILRAPYLLVKGW